MTGKLELSKEDLYGIIGVSEDASEKQILKSYRKQALRCHPDKNPDNPKAASQFHKLTQALDILTDAAAKAAYDAILKAKKATQLRHKQYDSKRKKFKEDLEARESAAENIKYDSGAAAKKFQTEVERLRKEGNRILEEVQDQLRRDLEEKYNVDDDVVSDEGETTVKIKAKWKIKKGENRDEGYTKAELTDMFEKYGEVLNIVVSVKKSGTAIIEMASSYTAEIAMENVSGKTEFPLTLTWLSGSPPKDRSSGPVPGTNTSSTGASSHPGAGIHSNYQSCPPPNNSSSESSHSHDFESVVLMRMRQAEERKRLIEQMQKEEDEKDT